MSLIGKGGIFQNDLHAWLVAWFSLTLLYVFVSSCLTYLGIQFRFITVIIYTVPVRPNSLIPPIYHSLVFCSLHISSDLSESSHNDTPHAVLSHRTRLVFCHFNSIVDLYCFCSVRCELWWRARLFWRAYRVLIQCHGILLIITLFNRIIIAATLIAFLAGSNLQYTFIDMVRKRFELYKHQLLNSSVPPSLLLLSELLSALSSTERIK